MAGRPWVTPAEVIAYTEYKQVQGRDETRLRTDIARAEAYVIAYTNCDFADQDPIPESVKTAVILLAEAYAYNAAADPSTGSRRLKSETFDDYSYSSDDVQIDINDLGVNTLLDPYTVPKARGGVTMRFSVV